jgi:hypothetical protein
MVERNRADRAHGYAYFCAPCLAAVRKALDVYFDQAVEMVQHQRADEGRRDH